MKGYDREFEDLPAYILGVTREVWEERGVERLEHYYTGDIPVRSPDGFAIGNQAVIDATHATLAEFPDRQLLGEDVIWCGSEELLSSHRIYSTATHLGLGKFGPPSGIGLRYRVIADCAVRDDRIFDEWLVRDQGAIVRQLGHEPRAFAAAQIEAEGGTDRATRPLMSQVEPPPLYLSHGNDDPVGVRYAEALTALSTDRDPPVEDFYDRAVHIEWPGGRSGHGRHDADGFWAGIRRAMPSAEIEVLHRIGRRDPATAPRAAIRWSIHGIHAGHGAFGEPTGAPIHVMGISHAELGPDGRIRREYVVFDEVAVWKQILLHTG